MESTSDRIVYPVYPILGTYVTTGRKKEEPLDIVWIVGRGCEDQVYYDEVQRQCILFETPLSMEYINCSQFTGQRLDEKLSALKGRIGCNTHIIVTAHAGLSKAGEPQDHFAVIHKNFVSTVALTKALHNLSPDLPPEKRPVIYLLMCRSGFFRQFDSSSMGGPIVAFGGVHRMAASTLQDITVSIVNIAGRCKRVFLEDAARRGRDISFHAEDHARYIRPEEMTHQLAGLGVEATLTGCARVVRNGESGTAHIINQPFTVYVPQSHTLALSAQYAAGYHPAKTEAERTIELHNMLLSAITASDTEGTAQLEDLLKASEIMKVVDWISKADVSPLMFAIGTKRSNVARLLIEHGANVNAKSSLGTTALHVACLEKDHEVMRLLIAKHADLHARATKDNITPLCSACRTGSIETVRVLIELGAMNEQENIDLILRCCKKPEFRESVSALIAPFIAKGNF